MDRAFEQAKINELCDDLKEIINDCKEKTNDIRKSVGKIKEAVDKVPSEGKDSAVSSKVVAYNSDAREMDFKTLEKKLTSCQKRVGKIVAKDISYATDTDTIKKRIDKTKEAVAEIKGYFGHLSVNAKYSDFSKSFEIDRKRWTDNFELTAAYLSQIQRNINGAETKSVKYSKDPVNLSTGNFVFEHIDLKVEGRNAFVFKRFYNTITDLSGNLGDNWVHNYEVRVKKDKNELVLILEEGKEERFLKTSTGAYTSLYQSNGNLEETEIGYLYKTTGQAKYTFNREGYYLRQESLNGDVLTLQYETHENTKRLVKVEKGTGEFFVFSYSKEGYIEKVEDHTGRKITYQMQGSKLIAACTPAGHWYRYGYSLAGKLESIQNTRGIIGVENTYDERQRTIHQKFSDGSSVSYEYDEKNSAVVEIERNGSKTIYIHDDKLRDIKHIYSDGEERFEYNKLNLKTLVVDKLGRKTQLAYDEAGNLTRVINAKDEQVHISYDKYNQPTRIEVGGEVKVVNEYDDEGNLIKSTDALGNSQSFKYQSKGRPQEILQPDGSKVSFAYDKRGNITSIINSFGEETKYTYDDCNRVAKVTDVLGNETTYEYDVEGNITKVINAKQDTREYKYNESNKVTEIKDFDGSSLKQEYNCLNKPAKVIDQEGKETLLTYDAMWNLARVTRPNGAKTTFIYNEYNQLGRIRNANGDVVRYRYDAVGNRIAVEDEEGNVTKLNYDELNRLTKVIAPDGATTTYEYNNQGLLSKVIDALGNEVSITYDKNGNVIHEVGAMGEERKYTYTSLGNIKTITNEANLTTTYNYYPGGRVKEVVYPDKLTEAYTYNKAGRIETYTNRDGYANTYAYDELGQVISITGADGENKTYTYDAKGNVTSFIDEKGNKTTYLYSLSGNLTGVIDALGNESEYKYDEVAQLIEVRQIKEVKQIREANEKNNILPVTKYERDLLGNITKTTDALGNSESYTYDKKSQLIQKVDKEGYLTTYGYQSSGEVESIKYADGKEVRLSYNALRQLEEMEDWLGITRIEPNARGQATKVSYHNGKEVSYAYGKAGEKTKITYPGGKVVNYVYDELYRLAKVTDEVGDTTYDYNEQGYLRHKNHPNEMESLYTYTNKGQLASLIHQDSQGIVDAYKYSYDIQGNKTIIEKQRRGLPEDSGTFGYAYDELQRLTNFSKDGNILRTYGYDALGNRETSTDVNKGQSQYTYNALNQLISRVDSVIDSNDTKEERYIYDKRGNLTETYRNNKLINQYHFGALNRLEKAVNHQTKEASEYMYNGLGHRIGKTISAPVEVMLPTDKLNSITINPAKKIEDTIDLTKQYHNLLQRAEGETITSFTWDNNVLRATRADDSNQYLQDDLGSPIRLFSPNGDMEEIYSYDEFGQETHYNQEPINQYVGINQPFTYTGYQKDSVANTYYAQAREYKSEMGRFTGEDIIKGNIFRPFTTNSYAYCWNNPIELVDLDGASPSPSSNNFANNVSAFVQEVKNIDFTNKDEGKVLEAKYVSAYDGQLVVRWTPNNRSFSMGPVMLLDKGKENNAEGINTVKHERGHYDQYKELGIIKYVVGLCISSTANGYFTPYYSQPWEVSADTRRDVGWAHTQGAEELGEKYMNYLKSIDTLEEWLKFLKELPDITNGDTSIFDGECPQD